MLCEIGLKEEYINNKVKLPYELTTEQINASVSQLYKFIYGLNTYLKEAGFNSIDEILLGNTISGIASELLIKAISKNSKTLIENKRIGGHPDLIPIQKYKGDSVLRGRGLEVKVTKRNTIEGHNPEVNHLIVFRYSLEKEFKIVEILCAKLALSDWNYSAKKEKSRRTPTATVNSVGMEKLRRNYIYRLPNYGVGKHKKILAS